MNRALRDRQATFDDAGNVSFPAQTSASARPTASASPAPALAPTPTVPVAPARESGAAELWVAVHLPALMLDAIPATASLRAVIERVAGVQRVVAVSAAARERGIAPGMALAAALALEPTLETHARRPELERALLERLAVRGGAFTPRVSLEPPDGLLLEVRGSRALFGGSEALCRTIEAECLAAGAQPSLALAPTPLAALAAARAGLRCLVEDRAALVGAVAPLSLATLRFPTRTIERLATAGVQTIGQALRLPRAGFARRFGAARLAELDRLTGRQAEPREAHAGRERFRSRIEPSFELATLDAVLAFVEPALESLERFLRRRQAGIVVLDCRLWHRGRAPTRCTLRLAEPAFEAEMLTALLGERLATLSLPAPVTVCELRSGELVPSVQRSAALWQSGEHGGSSAGQASALLERLRARLGNDSVQGLCEVAEHRPEVAWRFVEPVLPAPGAAAAPNVTANASIAPIVADESRRPLWLLAEPLRLRTDAARVPHYEGPLRLESGVECIESGWWDGGDVERDYFIARNPGGARLWIYRERRASRAWFLHGLFG